jgi:hypothetical protein
MASQVSFKSGAQQPDLDYAAVDGYLWGVHRTCGVAYRCIGLARAIRDTQAELHVTVRLVGLCAGTPSLFFDCPSQGKTGLRPRTSPVNGLRFTSINAQTAPLTTRAAERQPASRKGICFSCTAPRCLESKFKSV